MSELSKSVSSHILVEHSLLLQVSLSPDRFLHPSTSLSKRRKQKRRLSSLLEWRSIENLVSCKSPRSAAWRPSESARTHVSTSGERGLTKLADVLEARGTNPDGGETKPPFSRWFSNVFARFRAPYCQCQLYKLHPRFQSGQLGMWCRAF